MIDNAFCFLYGKLEPELVLSAIHKHGPLTAEDLHKYLSKGYIKWYLPFVIRRGHAVEADGKIECRCGNCR